MKQVIQNFIKDHPIMTFLLADIIVKQGCSMVKTVVRGYPAETTITSGKDEDDDPKIEVVEPEEESSTE